jgi:hypothetical protein
MFLEGRAKDNPSSLFGSFVNYGVKSFMSLALAGKARNILNDFKE